MPETRGRSFFDQIGAGDDRTKVGRSRGEGIVNGFARLASQSRDARTTSGQVSGGSVASAFGTWGDTGMEWTGLTGFTVDEVQNLEAIDTGFYVVTIRVRILADAGDPIDLSIVGEAGVHGSTKGVVNGFGDPYEDGLTALMRLGSVGPSFNNTPVGDGSTFQVRAAFVAPITGE